MYYLCRHINVRDDLIVGELSKASERFGCRFIKQKLTRRFIRLLFKRYRTDEFSIHFFDSEPDLREDISWDDPWWSSSEGVAYQRMMFDANEERRMHFNNWIDPIGPGIWGMSQSRADRAAREMIESVRDWPVRKDGRVWFACDGEKAILYCYGRDIEGADYWQLMTRRSRR